MIPTSTGAARAVGEVLPELKGKLDGMAVRVPTANVSVVDLVAELDKTASADAVNQAMQAAAEGPLKGVLQYCQEELVSVDFNGNPHSSIFDAALTKVMDNNFVKVLSWYDNEWGFFQPDAGRLALHRPEPELAHGHPSSPARRQLEDARHPVRDRAPAVSPDPGPGRH